MPVKLLRSTSLRSNNTGFATGAGPVAPHLQCFSSPATPRSMRHDRLGRRSRAMPPVSIVSAGLPRVIAVFDR